MEKFLRSSERHVVCFTHNEYSHIAPMFAMARALASHGLRVTCALPRSSYDSHFKTLNNDSCDIRFDVEPVEESPEHASDDVVHLHHKLRDGLMQLMQRLRPSPSILIADLLYYPWAPEVASHLGVPLYLFSVFPAITLLLLCYMPELLQRGLLPFQPGTEDEVVDCVPGLMEDFRVRDIPIDFCGRNLDGLKALTWLGWKKCAGIVLCNTSDIFPPEAEAMDALCAWGLRIYTVGPMLRMDAYSKGSVRPIEDETCMKWLNAQPAASVVYASFGSIISLTGEEVREVALGLEASGQPFLWAVREIEGFPSVSAALPEGFLERVSGRGLIVAWAPQTAVLAHPSVGCFLFHSGASSAMEAIWAGVPMIGGFYKISDQNTVHRIIADGCGALFSLTQTRPHDPANPRSSLSAAIKEVLFGHGVGAAIRQRVSHLQAAMREATGAGGHARRSLDKLVEALFSASSSNSQRELHQRGDAALSTCSSNSHRELHHGGDAAISAHAE